MELSGLISYGIFFLTLVSVYSLLTLGLNLQWGYTGMMNIGIAAFFALGAYTTAILTSPEHVTPGGFGLPVIVGLVAAMICAGILALAVGYITVNLRTDYLAIATIGIAEIVRLFLKNEDWLTNGVRGMAGIPKPLSGWMGDDNLAYLLFSLFVVALVYLAIERGYSAPWGRVLRGIRDNETAAAAMGKNVRAFRLQAFVIGSSVMGLAGAMYAHFVGFISPEAFDPLFATFIVWVMLISGGSGNNLGAMLGALVIWGIWSFTEMITTSLPPELTTQMGALRVFLIGLFLQVILIWRPQGILPEKGVEK